MHLRSVAVRWHHHPGVFLPNDLVTGYVSKVSCQEVTADNASDWETVGECGNSCSVSDSGSIDCS